MYAYFIIVVFIIVVKTEQHLYNSNNRDFLQRPGSVQTTSKNLKSCESLAHCMNDCHHNELSKKGCK